MLSILSWIVTGLIIGLIARAIVPGRQSIGFILTVLLGIGGAFVGGLISSAIWGPVPIDDPDYSRMWPGWIMSVVGAVILLWGYVALMGRSDRPATNRLP
jgi:uncharacterized membrane protein YeaQ/YmgE (transglycosylase-associated protein family)